MRYFLLFFLASNVWASSFEECIFEAELKLIEKENHRVLFTKLIKEDGHMMGQCKRFLGIKRIQIKNFSDHKDLKKFKLRYSSYSGMGPNGVVSSKSWQIVK